MADRVTCCPHCSTSFRITDAQMKTAKGAVRCGSCLQIFKALDNLAGKSADPIQTGPAETSSPEPSPEEAPLQTKATAPDELDDDDLISDDMDHIEDTQNLALGELSDAFSQQGHFGQHKGSLFDREIKITDTPDTDSTDESWAINLLQDDEDDSLANRASEADALPADTPTANADYSQANTGSFIAISNSDIENVLGEPLSDRKEPIFNVIGERHHDADGPPDTHDQSDTFFNEADTDEPELEEAVFNSGETEPDTTETAQPTEQQQNASDLLQGIAAAPVEMEWPPEKSPWPRRLLWSSLSLLASTALCAQFAWIKFDELGRQQPWRQWYAQACPILDCQLPPLTQPHLIKAYNLVIRSHPRAENALVIDSILLNTANFEQPFPDFALSFSDLQGNPLAQRRFTPRQYLGGEMAGIKNMPSGQPVHISLEIVDPGPEAVNYSAEIPLTP